jgi:hypothetical protein
VIQAAILVQELQILNACLVMEVLNLMQIAVRAVRIFMIPILRAVETATVLVLLAAQDQPQVVSPVKLDFPLIQIHIRATLQQSFVIPAVKLVVEN